MPYLEGLSPIDFIAMRLIALFFATFLLTGATSAQNANQGFGGALHGMDGQFVAGSAPVGWPSGSEPAGTVFRYAQSDTGEWEMVGALQSPSPEVGDHFGRSVLLHGPHILVGAPGQGAVHAWERNESGDYQFLSSVSPESLPEGYEFGGAYARAGQRSQNMTFAPGFQIAVTAFNAATSTGEVHLFNLDGPTTVLRGTEGESFGFAVVGDVNAPLFIGVPGGEGGRGAVDVYVARDGMMVPEARLTAEDLPERSGLGRALAYHDGTLYAGVPGLSAVLRWQRRDDGSWTELERLTHEGASGLGSSVAAAGGRVAASDRRSVWIFEDDSVKQVLPPDERAERGFGVSVALAGHALAVGSPSTDYGAGIATVFEVSGDDWSAVETLAPQIEYISSMRGTEIECQDGEAGMFACDNVDMVSFLSTGELIEDRGVQLNDIWGWEDPETGHEWVLLGRTDGTAFVNIADPANPVYVGQLLRTEGSPGASWRDIKVYRNHAYIVADGSGEHGVQVFDLTQLRDVDPAAMPVTFEPTNTYHGTASTHNMVINEETGFGYAVGNRSGGETCNGQLHMMDLSDPANPTFAGCFFSEESRGTHDAQCVSYRGPDADYSGREICLASNGSSFVIADVTDKESPRTVALTTYPMTHYTHQGWLDETHSYFYMNDELDEMNGAVDRTRTLIWDVKDLDDPQLVNQFYLNSRASDHNLYIRDNYMYQSNYQAGLRILDISDPVNPVEVGNFDTSPYAEDAPGFGGSWSNYPYFKSGVIAVSSGSEGLFLVRFRRLDS